MPELPDLQVFSLNLSKKLAGKVVAKIYAVNKKKLKTAEEQLKASLEGAKLLTVSRSGKELHLDFDNGNILALHMMLHGGLHIFDRKNDQKFPIIELLFKDGTGLAMSDFQGQATATLNPPAHPGADALTGNVDTKFFRNTLARSKATVKSFLLDQQTIRGIGNAYADEILWHAGISPFSAANKIPDTHLKALAKAIKSVLRRAEEKILKSNPDIISGEVRDFLDIHNPEKTHSPTGGKIEMKIMGGRKTYFTAEQTLFS